MKALAILLLLVLPLSAQMQLAGEVRTNGETTLKAFAPLELELFKSSALIYDESYKSGRRYLQFGTVMSADGYVMTKASSLPEDPALKVRIGKVMFDDVVIASRDDEWDVVLLKVDSKNLELPTLAESSEVAHGMWVVMNGGATRRSRPVRVGVLSAKARKIGPEPVNIGVKFEETSHKLIVSEVIEGSGAEAAGIKEGDQFLKLGEAEVLGPVEFQEALEGKQSGDWIDVLVQRDDETLSLEVELKSLTELTGRHKHSRNDAMSGDISHRRYGFPRVIQHDVYGSRRSMGGPVHLLDGQLIGMNIARFDRVTTYAIPVEELKLIFMQLLKESKQSSGATEEPKIE